MKKLLKRLTPNAFRRIDDYLLRNYPTVWRTRIHVVLPLALLAAVLLFVVGYCAPNTFTKPLVDPIVAIEITTENYFLIPFTFAVVAVLYWGYTQYQHKFTETKPLKVAITLLIYGIGLFVILALDTTAFRLGTILKTANLMNEEDLKYVRDNDCFLYGFFPHKSIKRGEEVEYFENDITFKSLWEREDSILTQRYNKKYLSYLIDLSDYDDVIDDYLRSDVSCRSYRAHLIDAPELPMDAYNTYSYDLWGRASLSDLSLSVDTSAVSYLLGTRSLLDIYYYKNKRFLKDNATYQEYYKTHVFSKLDTTRLSKYELDFSFKEFKYYGSTFDIPQYFYPLEDGVRSVVHAKQFLREKIVNAYFKSVLQLIPFILLLFFTISFSSQEELLVALVVGLIVYFFANYIYGETLHSASTYRRVPLEDMPFKMHKEQFLPYWTAGLAVLSLFVTSLAKFINQESKLTIFFLNLFIVTAIGTALIPVFIENLARPREGSIYYVKTWVFYFTAALCLIAPVLFSYLKGLPKSR